MDACRQPRGGLPYARDELQRLGISDRLVRLSVGIEAPDDLIGDLAQALDAAGREAEHG